MTIVAPHNPLLNGHRRSFLEVKRPWRDVYNSSPSVAGVRNEWSCANSTRVCLESVQRDKFTCTVTSGMGPEFQDLSATDLVRVLLYSFIFLSLYIRLYVLYASV